MAWPWIFESNFEAGTNAEWDSEEDDDVNLDFPHYTTLARSSGEGPMAPFRGAYCMRVILDGGTNPCTVTEGDLDIADTVTRWSSFDFYISPLFAATADDIFVIYQLQSAGPVNESCIGLRITATTDVVEVGVGKLTASTFAAQPLQKGRWYHFDLRTVVQTGGTGTTDLYIDGVAAAAASVDTVTNVAVAQGKLGLDLHLSTTTGTLLFDNFRFDDTQVYPVKHRYEKVVRLTKNGHVFVGPGWIDSCYVRSASGTLVLHDTDVADVNHSEAVVDISTTEGSTGFEDGAYFERGCYAVVSANTEVEIRIHTGGDFHLGKFGPKAHWSPGAVRHYGQVRKAPRPNV
mgnify:CR=1 FL=1